MSELNAVSGKPVITFSCDDKQICEEIIALKTFVFSLLRMMPEDISLDVVKNLSGNGDNPPLNRLCTEMVDAMIATSTHVQEH
ncbi:hypothetical protein N3553_24290 [Pantoea dispersa]|uniref:hypothetical protein n=1 Tax=Pantoea dispersa TaxID=59814 RepID=UPI0021AEAE57|nr:hypothetical protein [Pantoea dispersa]MCT6592982.1 hypothetical protein [Pantoea dispersa]